MNKTVSYSKTRTQTFDLIITALLIALVFVATLFLNIKLPITANGGLVHLGTGMLFIASILFGPKKGALAGAIGMGLFDLFSGWTLWAPITFVARGIQGYIVGKFAWMNNKNGSSIVLNLIGMIISIPFMIAVYYVGEGILYGNWIAPVASIPGDLVQNILGIIIAIPVCLVLKKVSIFK
ncbi:membrane protein [Ureibacillus massiliensis 4400831 = CIP 108448 = CCUG 49529]|uniref:Membrane protein n=1 Tax=Ureibacillus massiliensis 4400831 = CIP 108448 = CCUG 49529 TaxID=1211035 RepID=A0A0A3JR40_9BACL|nr:ECF transporter S component [Ureibacillus massiliensis]KGR89482.1 membrane protein [Ureibacillus massiliensis 4400831 = CIP 108448 = CCUG 49529]